MTHTHNLIEAKISMKARKQKQRKKRNYNTVDFRQLLLCFFLCLSVEPSFFRARLHGEFHPGLKFEPG